MKKYTIHIILIIILLILCFACAKQDNSKVIKVWTFWKKSWFKTAFDKFEQKYPGLKIEYQQLSWSNGEDKITTSIAADDAPDVVELGSTWIPKFIENNILSELNLDTNEIKSYINGFEGAAKNKKIFGVPLFSSVNVMFYNKNLFKKANIKKIPETLHELLNCSKKINNLGKDIYGYSIKISGKFTTWQKFLPFLWSFNGKVISDDFKNSMVNSTTFKQTLNFYNELSKYSFNAQQDAVRQAFYMGKIGIIYDGAGLNMDKNAPNINYGTFIFPGMSKDKPGIGFLGADYLSAIKKINDKHLKELIIYMTKYNSISEHLKYFLPFYTEQIKIHKEKHPELSIFFRQLKNSKTPPLYSKWEQLMEVISYSIESIVLKKSTPDIEINNADKKITEILQQ